MGLDYEFSDYGSGSSSASCLSWGDGMGTRQLSDPAFYRCRASSPRPLPIPQKRNSFMDATTGLQINSIDAVMQEFRMNGLDSPYDPEEEKWSRQADKLSGMGPSSAYVRQKSWPEPDATPALRLPSRGPWTPTTADVSVVPAQKPVPVHVPHETPNPSSPTDMITEEQVRALNTIPNVVLYALLRDLEAEREVGETKRRRPVAQECRFCKNNGEREAYYRSHALKDAAGRVCCPVLRAFACSRCGARGDSAHTLKYCPLTPAAERIKSAAMMRSVRHTASRRRSVPPSNDFVLFGQTPSSVIQDTQNMYDNNQLQPEWAALLQKLTL